MARVVDERTAAVLEHVSAEETLELSRELVRIPSITGKEGREVSEYMHAWLRDNGLTAGLQEIQADRVNVWARVDGKAGGKRLLLNGHLDTKPVENMTIDPFAAEVKDGRLYGRGACDMKSAVAAAKTCWKPSRSLTSQPRSVFDCAKFYRTSCFG